MPTARPGLVPLTPYEDLDAIVRELSDRAQAILGDNLVGVYVQGSFALGDGDMHSDCDFLIPVHRRPTAQQEAQLRAFHDELPTRPQHWAQHLEGSYPVAEELRTLRGLGREWLYIDHGWRRMQWSTHCNSEVARWILYEHGICVRGPSASSVVDLVPAAAMRDAAAASLPTVLADIESWVSLDIAWGQRYAVVTIARTLYTLQTGRVASKPAALRWAMQSLDPRWWDLLERTLTDRSRGFDPDDRARPGSVEATRRFSSYAVELLRREGTRPDPRDSSPARTEPREKRIAADNGDP